jgi:hypothetical protein
VIVVITLFGPASGRGAGRGVRLCGTGIAVWSMANPRPPRYALTLAGRRFVAHRFGFGYECRNWQTQDLGDCIDRIQTGIPQAPLNQADVRLVELRLLGEGFPAQLLRRPVALQHDGERIR